MAGLCASRMDGCFYHGDFDHHSKTLPVLVCGVGGVIHPFAHWIKTGIPVAFQFLRKVWNRHRHGLILSAFVSVSFPAPQYFGMGKAYIFSWRYHHVCWYLAHGYWPTHPIDHANRNDKDNSLCNLRPTDDTRNAYNKPSIAAFKGVTKRPGCSTYRVRISVDGKRCDLGRGFVTAEAAFDAYKEASTQLHKEFSCVERRL